MYEELSAMLTSHYQLSSFELEHFDRIEDQAIVKVNYRRQLSQRPVSQKPISHCGLIYSPFVSINFKFSSIQQLITQWAEYTRSFDSHGKHSGGAWNEFGIFSGSSNILAKCSIDLCVDTDSVHHFHFVCTYWVLPSPSVYWLHTKVFTSFVFQMPETPLWLLSRNRQEEALKSLQWLRGWVDSKAVQNEFNDLQRCRISAQICYQCEKQNKVCEHPPPTIRDKVRDLFRRRTLRPFVLIASLFFFAAFCGMSPYRPYIVQILYFYKSPIDPNQVVVWLGYTGLAANIVLVATIRSLGKRSIYLWSMAVIILFLFGLGTFDFSLQRQFSF